GLGSPHRHDALTVLQQYLGKLEVPPQRRMLAAFGPRALRVARERFAGAMPMLFTPEYTTVARRSIGDDRTLSVGLYAVLDEDPVR
ncbi:LLM class F420-dependent oxidoreductase, partial [Mycobacterium sp. ITM-2017-0098]